MVPPGTHVGPALAALAAACRARYGRAVFAADTTSLLELAPERLIRLTPVRSTESLQRVAETDLSFDDLSAHGAPMLECLGTLNADLFVVGDAASLRLAGRIALLAIERAVPCRVIGLPACPYNGVPFSLFNIGYGSALQWCAAIATSVRASRLRDARRAPVGILHISGDHNGWLAAGAAALAGTAHRPAFCITPGMAVKPEALARVVRKAVERDGTALVVMGDIVRDGAGKQLAPAGHSAAAVRQMLAAHARLEAVATSICPGDLLDAAHVSARDEQLAARAARAAVRLCRTAPSSFMVASRADGNRISFHATNLEDAQAASRQLPPGHVSASSYQPAPALRACLVECLLDARRW